MKGPFFLIGFMASGKTTLGQRLSKKLGWNFIDLDAEIVRESGHSIPEYFSLYGEEKFRQLESEVLKKSTSHPETIISTGGGAPCYYDNMDWMLSNGQVIYLKLSPSAIFSRLNSSKIENRPALNGLRGDDLLAHITDKLNERKVHYERAPYHVDPLHNPIKELLEIAQNQSAHEESK